MKGEEKLHHYYEEATRMVEVHHDRLGLGLHLVSKIKTAGTMVDEDLRYDASFLRARILKVMAISGPRRNFNPAIEAYHECLDFMRQEDYDLFNANIGLLHYMKGNEEAFKEYFSKIKMKDTAGYPVYACCIAEASFRNYLLDADNVDEYNFTNIYFDSACQEKTYPRAFERYSNMLFLVGRDWESLGNMYISNHMDHLSSSELEAMAFTGEANLESRLVQEENRLLNDFYTYTRLMSTGH